LVCPKDNKTFPKDVEDWQWLYPQVPDVVRGFYKKGYGIYIVTNQTKEWKKDQIVAVMHELGIPVTVCIAWIKEERKPSRFLFEEVFTEDQRSKMKDLFMCGDALGRVNDHSDDDLKFGENIGAKKIISPEMMFLGKKDDAPPMMLAVSQQEVVIMTGYPGSGKSTLCEKVFEPAGYAIIHGDVHKTSAKMLKVAEGIVKEGKSVVFDATNPSVEKRAEYIEFANKHGLPARCIHVATSLQESLARNNMREKPVPRIVFNVYTKKFKAPDESEGCSVVVV
jgi:bifunctional polynucleotide phosphatase/kinase